MELLGITILHNGIVVTENEILNNYSVVIANKIIINIVPSNDVVLTNIDETVINCTGKYILPGLIDIHSDVIEKVIVPRKGVKFDHTIAIYEIDKQLSQQGITTVYHSISIASTTICNNIRTLKIDDMFDLCNSIAILENDLLIKHRFHARFELNTISAYDLIISNIQAGRIHELSFMDHTPGQGQYRDYKLFEDVIRQQYGNIPYNQRQEIIRECCNKPKLDVNKIDGLINIANYYGIPLAYHDVETIEQVDWMLSNNFIICEFPLNSRVADYAIKKGLYCAVGAPNVILGHSHYNNASATTLLSSQVANILCSDYFSPTLLLSIFKLYQDHNFSLSEAVRFATLYPAQALGISNDVGSIAINKSADIIIVDASRDFPRVIATIVNGCVKSTLLNYC